MNNVEDDNALNIDLYMNRHNYSLDYESDDYSEDETNFTLIPQTLVKNRKIAFGFFEKSNNSFYEIISCLEQLITIKNGKYLVISFNDSGKKMKCIFNIIDNYPSLIIIHNSKNLNLNEKNCKKDILISFTLPPKFIDEKDNIPSYYLMENYNKDNNLRCLDCPFRNILIKDVNDLDIMFIKTQIFFLCRKNDIILNGLKYYNSNDFFKKIRELKEEINNINNNDFYSNYITYANISENLQKQKFESVISIYENFKNNFKIKKYISDTRIDKNSNSFFILKHISITPSKVKIKKEMFHQSSRFLRLYYHNNNFVKLEFKDENDNQLYTTTDYSNFNKFSKMSLIYDLVFKEGLNLCGIHYDFFLNPTNCMRSNTLWLLDEKEKELKNSYYKELGSSELLKNSLMPFSKLLSRFSQNFTSTNAYNLPFEYEIIPDIKSKDGKYVFNDGCGMISKDLIIDVCNKLNKGVIASAIQIRFKGSKGVLVVNENIKGRKVLLTESMVKFYCNNTDDLEVIRFSRYSPGFLNLQIIIILILNGIKKKIIYSIAKKEVLNYRNYHKNNQNLIKDEKFSKVLNDIENQNKILNVQRDYMSKIAKSTYIYNRLCNISKKYRFHMKKCAFLIGVCDFNNILEENEVFVQLCNDTSKKRKIITGDVLITKNPCLSIYDLQKVKAVYKEEFKDLYYNIVIFPNKGKIPIPNKITGSDLDGDVYWICWEQKFLHIENRDYTNRYIPLKNDEKMPEDVNLKYHFNEKGEKIRNTYFFVKTYDYNKSRDINNKNLSFIERCLDFHKFFHSNYKLPEVNRGYLSYITQLFKCNKYINEGADIEKLEKFAFYHSVEVDFQKAGETSNFIGEKMYPTFLQKNELRKKSNFLIKLKEIYDEYLHLKLIKEINIDFYDYLNRCSDDMDKEIYKKSMTLFDKQRRDKDMYERSFIYKLYELITYFTPMQKSFVTSIFFVSEEYFYENQIINQKKFSLFYTNDIELIKEILIKVKDIVLYYESEIKYIMMENEIYIETELMYLTDFLEPKIAVFKNDVEDYKINLNEQIKYCVQNCISKLNELKKSVYTFLTKENIEDMIFINIFWVVGNNIKINDVDINVDDIIQRKYRIISRKQFIDDLIKNRSYDQMKFFFYENLKCFSLYNYYCKDN